MPPEIPGDIIQKLGAEAEGWAEAALRSGQELEEFFSAALRRGGYGSLSQLRRDLRAELALDDAGGALQRSVDEAEAR